MNKAIQHDAKVRQIILIEGFANLIVLLAKVSVGLMTGSMAILADAVHSLTDLTNNLIAWFVIRVSYKPADREHPYGHRKFETLAVFILASLLVVLSIELMLNTLSRPPSEIVSSPVELAIMLSVLGINIGITSWQHYWARRLDSDILHADASHTFADVLITSVVIVGWQLSSRGYMLADKLCAIGVALVVLYLAYKLFRRALPVLLDEYAIDPQEIRQLVKQVDGVVDVYRIRSRWIGKSSAIDLVISVSAGASVEDSHRITEKIESEIENKFHTGDISIHVEPASINQADHR